MFITPKYLGMTTLVIWVQQCLGDIWLTPLNAAGLRGKSVIFECSTTDLNDEVQWFYRSRGGRIVSLWKRPGEKNLMYFDKVEVIQKMYSGGHLGFDLKIDALQLGDEGNYACVVGRGKKVAKRISTLSVLGIDSCFVSVHRNVFSHDCRAMLVGPAKYKFRWRCRLYGMSELVKRSEEFNNNFGEKVPLQVIQTSAKFPLPEGYLTNITTCALEIVSVNDKLEPVSYFDPDLPYLNVTVVMVSELPPVSTEPENCIINSEGILQLEFQIIFHELYIKRHRLHEPEIRSFAHTCIFNRGITEKRETHPRLVASDCEDLGGLDCLKRYRRRVEMGMGFPNIPYYSRRRLCSSINEAEKCLSSIEPCTMSKRMKGLMESYRFLCQSVLELENESLSFEISNERCLDHYPQSIANIFINGSLDDKINSQRLRNISAVNYAFCQHLAGLSVMHCTEHMLASYKSLYVSKWYATFVSLLNQIDLFRLMAFSEVLLTDAECWDTMKPLDTFPCPFAEDCATVYHYLLRTIHFGFIFVDNYTNFDKMVCRSNVNLGYCRDYLVNNCDIPTLNLYSSLTSLRKALCGDFKDKSMKYRQCFTSLYVSSHIPDKCYWSHDFMSYYAQIHFNPGKALEGCQLAKDHILCIQGLVTQECGAWAGRLQKELLKIIFSETILQVKCLFNAPLMSLNVRQKFQVRSHHFNGQPKHVIILSLLLALLSDNR